ncbi:MAG TPA: YajG family lipoprotein [Burkholderiales bacterium]|nr:YajG family lipoprotein [Burkholderiales bacterium]
MNAKFQFASIFLSLSVVQGCALAPQTVHLAPQVQVPQSDVGKGKVIGLDVTDTRADKKVGIVGDEKIKFVPVLAEDQSPSAVYREAADALVKLGFKVEPASGDSERVLRIELSELEYQSLKRPFTFDTEAKVTLAAIAQNGPTRLQRTYETEEASTSGSPPTQGEIARTINDQVSKALDDVLADKQLIALLSK